MANTYVFSIGGAFTGSMTGSFTEHPVPINNVVSLDDWRDLTQLDPAISSSVTSSTQLVTGSIIYASCSMAQPLNFGGRTWIAATTTSISGNISIDGVSFPQSDMVIIPASSWVSGNNFTVFADVYRPTNILMPVNPPFGTTAPSGSFLLMDPSGTIGSSSFTIGPFYKVPNAVGAISTYPSISFQSLPGTGPSVPVSLSFSVPIYAITVTIGDPTYNGNYIEIYDSASVLIGSVTSSYTGMPGLDIPATYTLTGSISGTTSGAISSVLLTPAPADYVYYSVIATLTSNTPLPPPQINPYLFPYTLNGEVFNSSFGSGIGFTINSGTNPCGLFFSWADIVPFTYPGTSLFYSGTDSVIFDVIFTYQDVGVVKENNQFNMINNGNVYTTLQYKDGTYASGSATFLNTYWQQGTWKRMGFDVQVKYDPINMGTDDFFLNFWVADAFTGDNRATFTGAAYYYPDGYITTLLQLINEFGTSQPQSTDLANAMDSGSYTITPALFISNLQSGSADWQFKNFTVVDNFRGLLTGSLRGTVTGTFGARFLGWGDLSGSADGIFTGLLSGVSTGTITSSYFDSNVQTNIFATYSAPIFGGNVWITGSPQYNVPSITGSYLYRSTFPVATPTTVFYHFNPPVSAVRFSQFDANIASGTLQIYDSGSTLLNTYYFSSGASTIIASAPGQVISLVTLTPTGTDYVYWSGPYASLLFPNTYSGSFSGSMFGFFAATSSWYTTQVIPLIPIISGTLISSISVSFGFGFVDVTGSRIGMILNAFTGSPQISFIPTPVNPNYIVPGDTWFITSGTESNLYYADYTSSLSGTIVPYQILSTEIPNTVFGGTW